MVNIADVGIIISAIATIIFAIKGDKDKMFVSLIIFPAIMLIKYLLS